MEKTVKLNKPNPIRRSYEKIGRNESCPCHSGQKYKNCCLKHEIAVRKAQKS